MTALRLIFFLLLLANVIFFAWQQNTSPDDGHEPQRLLRQIDPDQLKLIAPVDTSAKSATSTTPAASVPVPNVPTSPTASPTTATPASPVTPQSKAANTKVAAVNATDAKPVDTASLLCKSFAGLTPDAAKAAQSAIASSTPAARVMAVPLKVPASWWVHIPPQANKAGADKKMAELKNMGVDDSIIINDEGPNHWAISLGLFSTKEAADAYLKKLNGLGVRSARIDAREKPTDKVRLDVTAPADVLGALAHNVKPLASATLGDCPAVAKNP